MSKILSRDLSCTHELQLVFIATRDNAAKVGQILQDTPEVTYSLWDKDDGKWRISIQSESYDDIEECEAKLVNAIEAVS